MKTLKIFLVLFFLSCASTVIASGTGGPPQLFRTERKKKSRKNLREGEAHKRRTIFFLMENPVLKWIQPFKQKMVVEDGQTTFEPYKIWPRIKLRPAGKYGLGALGLGTLFAGVYGYFNWYKK